MLGHIAYRRLVNLDELVEKNGLEGPVAGNFIRNNPPVSPSRANS